MHEVLRGLALREPTDMPVLSIYLDMRQQATGESPGRRVSLTILRDRLRAIESTLGPRGEDLESFQADDLRIRAFLDDHFDRSSQGLAVFACSGTDLWETIESGTPFADEVQAGPVPQLFQLARLIDEQPPAIVAVVDSNTARLFVSELGRLEELGGPDEDPSNFQKRSMGGWSQSNYQRHIAKHHEDFAQEAADAIVELFDRSHAQGIVLAGDEVALTPLLAALPERLKVLLGEVLRIDIRAPRDAIASEVVPVLARMAAEAARSIADRAMASVRSDGLGVAGPEPTHATLRNAQVGTLLLSTTEGLAVTDTNELIRLAAATDADIAIVGEHAELDRVGGVGGILRYRFEPTNRANDVAVGGEA